MSSPQTSTIQIRIDSKTKSAAQSILKKLGTDLSSATKMFLTQVIRTKSIPFVARTENGYTPEYEKMILEEWKAMKAGQEKSFDSFEEFMADLNS
jgi:addiction module RelB/DinJ family antitoxin